MRLTYTSDEGMAASVYFSSYNEERRPHYRWRLFRTDSNRTVAEGSDLSGGVDSEMNLTYALGDLLGFIDAWDESGEDGELADMFPENMRTDLPEGNDWAAWAQTARHVLGVED